MIDDRKREPGLCIVVPVRNRTEHLCRTLPTWHVDDAVMQIVISDFGSDPRIPDDIVRASPKVTLVRSGFGEPWNKGLAQNIGVQLSRYETVLKSDCDVFYHDLRSYADLREGAFVSGYIPVVNGGFELGKQGCCGQVLFHRSRFLQLGGYHEFMHGWGFDDQDLYNRLEDAGLRHRFFDLADMEDIPHDDVVRGGATLADDDDLPIPEELRRQKYFQNLRNKLIAGLVPWHADLRRSLRYGDVGDRLFHCELGPRSLLERRTQLVAAYLACQAFGHDRDEVARHVFGKLIDERLSTYPARARHDRSGTD